MKNIHRTILLVSSVVASSAAGGCSSTSEGGRAERRLIDEVAEAMGGVKATSAALETTESAGRRVDFGEGRSPTEPLLMSDFREKRTASVTSARLRHELSIDAKAVLPQPLSFLEVIDARVGYVEGIDNIFGGAPRTPLFPGRVAGQLRHFDLTSPLRLLRAALAGAGTITPRPDEVHSGKPHRVLALSLAGAPEVRLFIDPDTKLIAKAETLEDHPPMGDADIEAVFADYRASDGVMTPFSVKLLVDGREVHNENRSAARVSADPAGATFDVPAELRVPDDEGQAARARRSSQWYSGFFYGGFSFFYFDQSKSEVEDVELAPGIHYLRGPSHHNLLVEQADGLTIVDAPMYVERTAAVLAHVKKQPYGAKPLRHVVATHFHQDHCGGIRELAAEGGVTVHAGAPTEAYFREVFVHPHTVAPDRFASAPKPVTVQGVRDVSEIPDAERPIQLHLITTSHAVDMLIVYLPKQKLLFTADIYGPNPETKGQLLPGDYRVWAGELHAAAKKLGLDVTTIVGAHGEGTATMDDVRVSAGL